MDIGCITVTFRSGFEIQWREKSFPMVEAASNSHGYLLLGERRVVWGENACKFLGRGQWLRTGKESIRAGRTRCSGVEGCGKTHRRGHRVWRFLYYKPMSTRNHLLLQRHWLSRQNIWLVILASLFSELAKRAYEPRSSRDGGYTLALQHGFPLTKADPATRRFNLPATDTKWTPVNNSITLGLLH